MYFLLSIVCSSMIEIVITASRLRAKMLEKWLLQIFDKEVTLSSGKKILLGQAIMDHCGTTALSARNAATSYIDAKNFTAALLEKVTYDPRNPKSVAKDIDEMITALENSTILPEELQGILIGYAHETKEAYKSLTVKVIGEIETFKSKIENWYDTNMERVSGSLKMNYTRKFTFWTALVAVLLLNADSISIAKYLYRNPEARKELAAQAYAAANSDSVKSQVQLIIDRNNKRKNAVVEMKDTMNTKPVRTDSVQRAVDTFAMKQLTDSISAQIVSIKATRAVLDDAIPLGWRSDVFYTAENKFSGWLVISKIAGLFMTILAIMMGAPFWFDVLNKISNLRGSGSKPPSTAK